MMAGKRFFVVLGISANRQKTLHGWLTPERLHSQDLCTEYIYIINTYEDL